MNLLRLLALVCPASPLFLYANVARSPGTFSTFTEEEQKSWEQDKKKGRYTVYENKKNDDFRRILYFAQKNPKSFFMPRVLLTTDALSVIETPSELKNEITSGRIKGYFDETYGACALTLALLDLTRACFQAGFIPCHLRIDMLDIIGQLRPHLFFDWVDWNKRDADKYIQYVVKRLRLSAEKIVGWPWTKHFTNFDYDHVFSRDFWLWKARAELDAFFILHKSYNELLEDSDPKLGYIPKAELPQAAAFCSHLMTKLDKDVLSHPSKWSPVYQDSDVRDMLLLWLDGLRACFWSCSIPEGFGGERIQVVRNKDDGRWSVDPREIGLFTFPERQTLFQWLYQGQDQHVPKKWIALLKNCYNFLGRHMTRKLWLPLGPVIDRVYQMIWNVTQKDGKNHFRSLFHPRHDMWDILYELYASTRANGFLFVFDQTPETVPVDRKEKKKQTQVLLKSQANLFMYLAATANAHQLLLPILEWDEDNERVVLDQSMPLAIDGICNTKRLRALVLTCLSARVMFDLDKVAFYQTSDVRCPCISISGLKPISGWDVLQIVTGKDVSDPVANWIQQLEQRALLTESDKHHHTSLPAKSYFSSYAKDVADVLTELLR